MSGPVNIRLPSSLSLEGVQPLLGNDLAGHKGVIDPIVTDMPCVEQLPDPVEKQIPNLYPACAVTCAMSKKESSDDISCTCRSFEFLFSKNKFKNCF